VRSKAPPKASEPVAASAAASEQEALRAKFSLTKPEWTRELDRTEKAHSIPWGYGRDVVVAMAVDPERLFAYWEVTDDAIARARAELGPAADDSWLTLRVHDVTGILFDGTNAHHHFDVGIARSDRQWFVTVGRPASTVVVELGVVARDGSFAKIARSHRVDFPRRDPAPRTSGAVEWMTVRAVPTSGGGRMLHLEPVHAPLFGEAVASDVFEQVRHFDDSGASFHEWLGSEFGSDSWSFDGARWNWQGPTFEERWESTPHSWSASHGFVADVPYVVETHDSGVTVERARGVTRVRFGPWRVEVRGVDASGGGRVLARWELRRSWVVASSRESVALQRWSAKTSAAALREKSIGTSPAGASELVGGGASESRLRAASELRLGGASELRWLGASERRVGGRSEKRLGGASESLSPSSRAPSSARRGSR
jgi:hypothetical protein